MLDTDPPNRNQPARIVDGRHAGVFGKIEATWTDGYLGTMLCVRTHNGQPVWVEEDEVILGTNAGRADL